MNEVVLAITAATIGFITGYALGIMEKLEKNSSRHNRTSKKGKVFSAGKAGKKKVILEKRR